MEIFWFVTWIAFAFLTALAAQARGRSFGGWLLIGCLFGVFALIAVLVMQREDSHKPVDTQPLQFPTATEAAEERKRKQAEADMADANFIEYYKNRRIERDGDQIRVLSRRFANVAEAREAIDNQEV